MPRYVLICLLACLGCGGSTGSDAPANVPTAATLGSLDGQQMAALCDWQNGKIGGYGKSVQCDSGMSFQSDASQAGCVKSLIASSQRCPTMTVSTVEACINALGGDVCRLELAPECAPLANC